MKKPWLVGAMCASVLFVYLPLAQANVVDEVETVMNKNVFGQSVFASSYATLSANSTINGDVSSGAATTLGAGAIVHGSTLAGAATTLGANVLVNGHVDSGAATTLGADSTVDGAVSSGAATTYGAGANVNWLNINSFTLATYATPSPVTQDIIDAQAFLSGLDPDTVLLPGNIGADMTFIHGVYEVAGPLSVSAGTTITLDAQNQSGVFIFNISDFLSFGAGVNVVMINDTEDTRVIWNITGTYISVGADANIIGDLLAKTYVSTGENSTAGGAYSATSYVTVGAGSEINEPSLGGGDNTPPVASNGPTGFLPRDLNDQPDESKPGFKFLFAEDADGDSLTYRLVADSLGPLGNNVKYFEFDQVTGKWIVDCIGVYGGHDSFQWVANDGQADSNVATQYFLCAI
ncbi:MAG: putative acyltransferase (DUF342 family) [Colwellia sp.]|jgi:predicted acyltransferase (DUF342 family)